MRNQVPFTTSQLPDAEVILGDPQQALVALRELEACDAVATRPDPPCALVGSWHPQQDDGASFGPACSCSNCDESARGVRYGRNSRRGSRDAPHAVARRIPEPRAGADRGEHGTTVWTELDGARRTTRRCMRHRPKLQASPIPKPHPSARVGRDDARAIRFDSNVIDRTSDDKDPAESEHAELPRERGSLLLQLVVLSRDVPEPECRRRRR